MKRRTTMKTLKNNAIALECIIQISSIEMWKGPRECSLCGKTAHPDYTEEERNAKSSQRQPIYIASSSGGTIICHGCLQGAELLIRRGEEPVLSEYTKAKMQDLAALLTQALDKLEEDQR
jgi:hypothetical protein